MDLAELGNKAELDQLGLELWLNWSLEDFPWWGGGGEKLGIMLKLRLGLAELGYIVFVVLVIVHKFVWWWMGGWCKVIFM